MANSANAPKQPIRGYRSNVPRLDAIRFLCCVVQAAAVERSEAMMLSNEMLYVCFTNHRLESTSPRVHTTQAVGHSSQGLKVKPLRTDSLTSQLSLPPPRQRHTRQTMSLDHNDSTSALRMSRSPKTDCKSAAPSGLGCAPTRSPCLASSVHPHTLSTLERAFSAAFLLFSASNCASSAAFLLPSADRSASAHLRSACTAKSCSHEQGSA